MGVDLIGDGDNGGLDAEVLDPAFTNAISGYAIYGSNSLEGPFTEFNPPEFVPFSEARGEDPDGDGKWDYRAYFMHTTTSTGRRYFAVVPVDGDSQRVEGLMSEPYDATPGIQYVYPLGGESGEVADIGCMVKIRPHGTTFQWDFGGGATPNTVLTQDNSETVTLGDEGSYAASVTVDNGYAVEVYEWTLEVTSEPRIHSVSPTKGRDGAAVRFTADWTGSRDGATFSWNFGGGTAPNTSTEESPLVTLGEAGTYNASLAIVNTYGSDTYNFVLRVGRPPVVTSVSPEEAVERYVQAFSVELEEYNSGPYEYVWDFGGGQQPTEENPEWTFYESGLRFCSVSVSNDFGSDMYEFSVLVHKNKVWLVAEPDAFKEENDWTVTVRAIVIDSGYPLRHLVSALVQYDELGGLVIWDNFDPGESGGGEAVADGIWEPFSQYGFNSILARAISKAVDYEIAGEPPPPAGSAAFTCNVSPILLPDPYAYEAPPGSGLSLSDYTQRNSGPTVGDVFNFTLKLEGFVPGYNNPTEVKVRMVNRIQYEDDPIWITYYKDCDGVDYEWDVIQDETPGMGVPDRYYLTIPIVAN